MKSLPHGWAESGALLARISLQWVANGAAAVKLGASRQSVIPRSSMTTWGLTAGDYLEVELYEGRQLLVTPKELVDKHPEIDKRLAEAEEDIEAGRVHGPFNNAHEAVKALRSGLFCTMWTPRALSMSVRSPGRSR